MEVRDITKLNLTELKALAYDVLQERGVMEKNFLTVQAEIERRLKAVDTAKVGDVQS